MALEKKISTLYFFIIGIISIILQVFFIPLIEIKVWRPDLIVLVTIYFGYRSGVIYGTIGGFLLGLVQDALGTSLLGNAALANCIIGFIAGQIKQMKLSLNAKILISIFLILSHSVIFYFFYQINTEITFLYLLFTRIFPNTIYTFIIGMIIYIFMKSHLE